jgi:hypothetical protein
MKMKTAAKSTGMAMMTTSMTNAIQRRASTPSNSSGLAIGS